MRRAFRWPAILMLLMLIAAGNEGWAQSLRMGYARAVSMRSPWYDDAGYDPAYSLRYNNRLDRARKRGLQRTTIPEDATFQIGPLYSTVYFTQSIGYRYVRTSGPGADYLYTNVCYLLLGGSFADFETRKQPGQIFSGGVYVCCLFTVLVTCPFF